MSLLNDALRDLEKRQSEGEAPQPVSPGLAVPDKSAPQLRLGVLLGIVCLLLVAAGGFYHFHTPAGKAQAAIQKTALTPAPKPAPAVVSAPPAPPPPVVTQPRAMAKSTANPGKTGPVNPGPKPVASPQPEPHQAVAAKDHPAPAVAKPRAAPTKTAVASVRQVRAKPAVAHLVTQAAAPRGRSKVHAGSSRVAAATTPAIQPQPAATAEDHARVVSPAPQSAAQKDRSLAARLTQLVQQGDIDRAVQLFKIRAAEGRDWPKSRKALVTALMANKDYARAEALLPLAVTQDYPGLRMLKGRLILATGGPRVALSYLQRNIPDIDAWPDYHATLATLLQQTGKPAKAAQVWSALLQLDNSNAAWWAGFGIALDSSGHPGQARQAYRQALLLPGLNAALGRYIQSRLAKLPQE